VQYYSRSSILFLLMIVPLFLGCSLNQEVSKKKEINSVETVSQDGQNDARNIVSSIYKDYLQRGVVVKRILLVFLFLIIGIVWYFHDKL